eukprot:6824088-Pyramimonas_sp.AAC.1
MSHNAFLPSAISCSAILVLSLATLLMARLVSSPNGRVAPALAALVATAPRLAYSAFSSGLNAARAKDASC